jgi:ribosomal protein S18 acetylase RimI-like enzyme
VAVTGGSYKVWLAMGIGPTSQGRSSVIIRPFTSADAAAVAAIHQASHTVPWSPSRFQAFATLVSEVEGSVVGFACHSVLHAPDREESLLLANLAVDPARRRRGNGRALLEARLRVAAGAGIRKAMAITQVSNEVCKALYQRYGFEEGARLPGYYDGAEDGIVRERALDPDAEPPWRDVAPTPQDRTPCETLSEAIEASQQGQAEHALALVDSLVGHPRFDHLARGYRAHLVSHREVASLATVELTTGLFATLAADPPLRRAEALRRAQVALLDRPPTAHPFFWAPFVLVGEGR